MEIFSAGTSGTSAEGFFTRLKLADVSAVVDTRIHPSSQLAAFAKAKDLSYFLRELVDIPYSHETLLCPEEEALRGYRATKMSWSEYEVRYLDLLARRKVETAIDPSPWGLRPLLLCSEPSAERCHRRLAAHYLQSAWGEGTVPRIVHL